MTAGADVKVRCPSCAAIYRLADHAIGRKARCSKCRTLFRVAQPDDSSVVASPALAAGAGGARLTDAVSIGSTASAAGMQAVQPGSATDAKRPPTEDDILRWLVEAESDADRERRAEREQDGVDAFDMPNTQASRLPRETVSAGAVAHLRLHTAQDEDDDGVRSVSLRRRVV